MKKQKIFRVATTTSLLLWLSYTTVSHAQTIVTSGQSKTISQSENFNNQNTIISACNGNITAVCVAAGTLTVNNDITLDVESLDGSGLIITKNGSNVSVGDNFVLTAKTTVGYSQAINIDAYSKNSYVIFGNNTTINTVTNYSDPATPTAGVRLSGQSNNVRFGDYTQISAANQGTGHAGDGVHIGYYGLADNNQLTFGNYLSIKAGNIGVAISSLDQKQANNSKIIIGNNATIIADVRAIGLADNTSNNTVSVGDNSTLVVEKDVPHSAVIALYGKNNHVLIGNENTLLNQGATLNCNDCNNVINLSGYSGGNQLTLSQATINANSQYTKSIINIIGKVFNNSTDFSTIEANKVNLNGGRVNANNPFIQLTPNATTSPSSQQLVFSNAEVNINNVSLNGNNQALIAVAVGTSAPQLEQYRLTVNMADTDARSFSGGVINQNGSNINLNLANSHIAGDLITNNTGTITLIANHGSTINSNIIAAPVTPNSTTNLQEQINITLNNGSAWHGNASNGGVISLANNSSWHLVDSSDIASLVNNGSIIYDKDSFNNMAQVLTVHGNYIGQAGSKLLFNGVLADDNTPIDKMHVEGDSQGESLVFVNNIGGLGANTVNGIELINVTGNSEANFKQGARIVAGGYDYTLQRSSLNSNNWVLFNSPNEEKLIPEVGSYIGNLYIANNLFNMTRHDRVGESRYNDFMPGEKHTTSLWLRHQYGYNRLAVHNNNISVKQNWNITQLGSDIAHFSINNGDDRLHLGIMAGYGRSKNNSRSNITGYQSSSVVDGYSYGLYGTWFSNYETRRGLYIDSWLRWSNLHGSISSDITTNNYRLRGLTGSIESGYTYQLAQFENSVILLEPQAQLTYQNVKARDLQDDTGTKISNSHGNLLSRLGIRSVLQAQSNFSSTSSGQLFLELNWLHNTRNYNVTLNNETTIEQDTVHNIGEIKIGVEGYIRPNIQTWFNFSAQKGENQFKNAAILLGLKYRF